MWTSTECDSRNSKTRDKKVQSKVCRPLRAELLEDEVGTSDFKIAKFWKKIIWIDFSEALKERSQKLWQIQKSTVLHPKNDWNFVSILHNVQAINQSIFADFKVPPNFLDVLNCGPRQKPLPGIYKNGKRLWSQKDAGFSGFKDAKPKLQLENQICKT